MTKKPTPTQLLKERITYLERDNYELRKENDLLKKEVSFLHRLTEGPTTLMIACEKIVEAAVQLTCSANTLLGKGGIK